MVVYVLYYICLCKICIIIVYFNNLICLLNFVISQYALFDSMVVIMVEFRSCLLLRFTGSTF